MECPPLLPVEDGEDDGFCDLVVGPLLEAVLPLVAEITSVDDSAAGVEEVGAGVCSDTVDATSDDVGCADAGSPPPVLVGFIVTKNKHLVFHCVHYQFNVYLDR